VRLRIGGPGSFGADSFRVVPGGHQELGGSIEPDSEHVEELRGALSDQGSEEPVECFGFLPQILNTLTEGSDGDQGRVSDLVIACSWPQP
jgi:hypothetical protein